MVARKVWTNVFQRGCWSVFCCRFFCSFLLNSGLNQTLSISAIFKITCFLQKKNKQNPTNSIHVFAQPQLGPVQRCVWADWACWTCRPCSRSRQHLPFIRSEQKHTTQQEHVNWRCRPGLASTLRWDPHKNTTSPLSFSIFNSPPTPSKAPHPHLHPHHPQLAAENGFSESSRDGDQRQITVTSMQNVTWKPPQLCSDY